MKSETQLNTQKYLRQANIGMRAEQYLSTAKLLSIIIGLIAGVVGSTLYQIMVQMKLTPLGLLKADFWEMLPFDETGRVMLFSFISGMICFALFASTSYYLFMLYPKLKARIRKTRINLTLPHAVAYMFALSKGGLNILEMFKSIADKKAIYQDTAEEFALIVRDIEFFGVDVITAIRNASFRTPSQMFKEFLDGLISVIKSGGNIIEYLSSKSDQFHSNALVEQKIFLETLGLLAEVYITVFVAGPLFLITIIVVIGLINPSSLILLVLVIYLLVPLSCAFFLVLLTSLSGNEGNLDMEISTKKLDIFREVRVSPATDQMKEKNLKLKLEKYDRWKAVKNALRFYEKPHKTFCISFIPGITYFTLQYYNLCSRITSFDSALSLLDDHLVVAALIFLSPFAICYEIRKKKINDIERQVPEFLRRLASMNEAGLSLTHSMKAILESNLGVLTSEVKRIWKIIEWGGATSEALIKFERRIKTMAISRCIAIMVKASEATSDIKEVLRITARVAEMNQALKRERFTNMLIYVIVVYISFFVFLFVVFVLSTKFLAAMPTGSISGSILASRMFAEGIDYALCNRLFYHASLIQGFCSGLIAGQMGEGSIFSGIKHSLIMITIALITFTVAI
ncbi:MAG: type II secretion system F family protein [Methanocellales archaeon]